MISTNTFKNNKTEKLALQRLIFFVLEPLVELTSNIILNNFKFKRYKKNALMTVNILKKALESLNKNILHVLPEDK